MDEFHIRKSEPTLRVMFVCTANVARSPYADRRTAMLLADPSVDITSAGVRARGGQKMDEVMAAELAARGGSGQDHRSRAVDGESLEGVDLIITLSYFHHMDLLQQWPEHADKIVGLRQLALAVTDLPPVLGAEALTQMRSALPAASMTLDVDDPYGRGKKAAARCASEIDEALKVIAPFLARASGAEPRLVESEASEPKEAVLEGRGPRRFTWGRGDRGRSRR